MKTILFNEKIDLGYYSGYKDVSFSVELSEDEIFNISTIIAREQKTKISIIEDDMPNTYEKIYDKWYNILFDELFYAGKRNWDITFDVIPDKDFRKNFESDIESRNFPVDPDDDLTFVQCLEHIESLGYDTVEAFEFWKIYEMRWLDSATTDEIRSRYSIDDWIDIDDEYHVCYFPSELVPEGIEICNDEDEEYYDEDFDFDNCEEE